jgi:predicted nucleic acid-binding Zn ribbon protein
MNRLCIQCDEPLYGRSDQRFCSASCRSHYHNQKREAENKAFYAHHKRLINNYRLLLKIVAERPHVALVKHLNDFGFKSKYVTEVYRQPSAEELTYFVYDIGFRYLDQKHIEVFRRDD